MKLGVIGAGPKALAIAAKAVVLRRLGFQVPDLVVVEKEAVAAHWVARSGLTSGRLPLGTSPEKDVGFPYSSFHWRTDQNAAVNQLMTAYSWSRFLIDQHRFAEWVDRGRPAPTHQRWAEYLTWVYQQVADSMTLVVGNVTGLRLEDAGWSIQYDGGTVAADGVVVTGPGKLVCPFPVPDDVRVYSVSRFWQSLGDFKQQARVAVVGTGETAAAMAATLGTLHAELRIDIVSPVAMSYSRGESYAENHVYSDPFQGNWFQMTPSNRRDFIGRTDRGVFSGATKAVLDELESIHVVPGVVTGVSIDGLGQLLVSVEYDRAEEVRFYEFVVVATGFDPLGFVQDLLDPPTQTELMRRSGLPGLAVPFVEAAIDEHLSIAGLSPRLHLPMLAGLSQGPGFANLSCLGRLSDHILSAYVDLEFETDTHHAR